MAALEGFAPAVVERVFVREQPELDLTLGGGGGVEGVVTPPADVYVREAHRKNPLRLDPGEEIQRESIEMETAFARADAEGRYRIDGLAVPGAYVVCAGTNESAVVELSAERPRVTVNLSSAAGPKRSIRVLDEHGEPLVGEWISLVGPTRLESVQVSGEGDVELPPGEWQVDVDGYLVAPAAPEVRLDRGVTLLGRPRVPMTHPWPGDRSGSRNRFREAATGSSTRPRMQPGDSPSRASPRETRG
jgi:hypothetical protein